MKRSGRFTRDFIISLLFTALLLSCSVSVHAAPSPEETVSSEETAGLYREYRDRLNGIKNSSELAENGFRIVRWQMFPVWLENLGEVTFIPAMEESYQRLALFFADEEGNIVFRTDQLACNFTGLGEMKQDNTGIAAVSFQDVDEDGLTDIVLITTAGKEAKGGAYKVGDVLYQKGQGFYRDWRVSDKINRFGMNKSVDFITAYAREGKSTEFLYTAATLEELRQNGFSVISEQSYWRDFEKLGRLLVVPGSISIADYEIFMIYLVNEQGYIVWSFQPMGSYDNLYALRGTSCRDIDGDGLKDLVVLARYSREGVQGELVVESDYSVYYQRTGGFSEDREIKDACPYEDGDTMEKLVEKLRSCWGWQTQPEGFYRR